MADLLSVIVGGVVAAGSGGAAQLLLHRQKVKHDERNLRAEKLEELVSAVYEYDHWLDTYRNVRMLGMDEHIKVSPFSKVRAIAFIYFPELVQKVAELEDAAREVSLWALSGGEKRLKGDTVNVTDGHREVYEPYLKAQKELLEQLRVLGERTL